MASMPASRPADPAPTNLTGFDDPAGVRLSLANAGAVDPAEILACLPPATLARGCGGCEWFLLPPCSCKSYLLRRDACHTDWTPVWPAVCAPKPSVDPVALAAWRRIIAIADRGAGRVQIWAQSGEKKIADFAFADPGAIAFSSNCELLVTSPQVPHITVYGRDGIARGCLKAKLPDAIHRIAVDRNNRVWVVTGQNENSWVLWRAERDDVEFKKVSVDELKKAFRPTGLVAASSAGFCLTENDSAGLTVTSCFNWCGGPLNAGEISFPKPPQRQQKGQLLTGLLDSGIPRCRWHRVRVDADVPAGTHLAIAVATSEQVTPSQGDAARDPGWSAFPAGPPHFLDWTSGPAGSLDFLIAQPVGRYLFVRLRFTGNGTDTPVVRRVRIDFPRVTSLEHIPAVYRENAKAEDFTERFLALFDASVAGVDRVIERYPALLDAQGVPEQLLPWLASFFDIGFDSTWDAEKRRAILQHAPELYRRRGTIGGLQLALKLIFGVSPAIDELSSTGTWGALGSAKALQSPCCSSTVSQGALHRNARVGDVRLFGKSRSRLRLNSSTLNGAPLRSYGHPHTDPFSVGAYRFRLLVPPFAGDSQQQRESLMSLVEAQKPAHTVASLRVGGTGFLLGRWSAVGIDTAFVPPAVPVLGSAGNIRLNRMSILWNGPRGREIGAALGMNSVVGIQTIAG